MAKFQNYLPVPRIFNMRVYNCAAVDKTLVWHCAPRGLSVIAEPLAHTEFMRMPSEQLTSRICIKDDCMQSIHFSCRLDSVRAIPSLAYMSAIRPCDSGLSALSGLERA